MRELTTLVLGPLAGIECRRSLGRGWLIVVRVLSAGAAGMVTLWVLWWWWIRSSFSLTYQPHADLSAALFALEGLALTFALLLTPALLAGSLAGDQERGALGLLLTTRVNSREIVLGRVTGKLGQLAMILLAGLPALVLIAALLDASVPVLGTLLALPAGVALGVGGIATAASAVSRRGWQALLVVYLLVVILLLTPLLRVLLSPTIPSDLLGALNPYSGLLPLTISSEVGTALTTAGLYSLMGLTALALAAWRLRPACLKLLGGVERRGRARRLHRVPEIGERPMLWKELYIERAANFGWFGRLLGLLLILYLVGSVVVVAWFWLWAWNWGDPSWQTEARGWLELLVGGPVAFAFSCLIQGAIGLRAAVAIASERERGTWDALLTSPLEGQEITSGKLWGTLFALRWLFAATCVAWVAALGFGAIDRTYLFYLVGTTLAISAFLSAFGVRVSLACPTATRAMAITIGVWVGTYASVSVLAWMVELVGMLGFVLIWLVAYSLGMADWNRGPWFPPINPAHAWMVILMALFAGATGLILSETRLRFDRIAGRLAGGRAAVAVDQMLHGSPTAPVWLGSGDREFTAGLAENAERKTE